MPCSSLTLAWPGGTYRVAPAVGHQRRHGGSAAGKKWRPREGVFEEEGVQHSPLSKRPLAAAEEHSVPCRPALPLSATFCESSTRQSTAGISSILAQLGLLCRVLRTQKNCRSETVLRLHAPESSQGVDLRDQQRSTWSKV